MADSMARVLGAPVRYFSPPWTQYAQFPFPGAADLANMFQFKHDFNEEYCARRPVDATRALHPGLQSFDRWLEQNATAFRAASSGAAAR